MKTFKNNLLKIKYKDLLSLFILIFLSVTTVLPGIVNQWIFWATLFVLLMLRFFVFDEIGSITRLLDDSKNQIMISSKIYFILFMVIILLYVFLRAPYLSNYFFEVMNGDKYSSYLPYGLNMVEQGSIFWNQNLDYISIFIEDSTISQKYFSRIPFYEWLVYLLYPLTKFISFELLVRAALTVKGIFVLWLISVLLNRFYGSMISLGLLALIVASPAFQHLTFITIMDLPAFAFLLLALVLYFKNKYNLAYISSGFSILMKYSFGLIVPVVFLVLILFKKENRLLDLIKLIVLSTLPLALSMIFIKYLPSLPYYLASLSLALYFIFLFLTYRLLENNEDKIAGFFSKISRLYKTVVLILLVISILFLALIKFGGYFANFVTDFSILFEFEIYKYIFERAGNYTNFLIFSLLPLSIILSFWRKKTRVFTGAIFLAILVYVLVASKTIFIHDYYKYIITIFAIIFFGNFLKLITESIDNKKIRLYSFAILILSLVIFSVSPIPDILSGRVRGGKMAAEYITEKTDSNDNILRSRSNIRSLGFYFPNRFSRLELPENFDMSSEQKVKNLSIMLKEGNFSYYLTTHEKNSVEINDIFSSEMISMENILSEDDTLPTRSQYILDRVGQHSYSKNLKPNFSKIFTLERVFDDVYVYRIDYF